MLRILTAVGVKIAPPPPKEARALNALAHELRQALSELDALIRRQQEEGSDPRLGEVSDMVSEGFARLEAEIARVGARVGDGDSQAGPAENGQ